MQLTGRITADSLMTLEAYSRWRPAHKAEMMAHRRLRTVLLGPHFTVQFEDERTMREQIQEMLRVEKVFDPQGIQDEVDAYAPLVPDGRNWKATLLIGYTDAAQRERALKALVGVAERLYVQVGSCPRQYAIADEDMPRDDGIQTAAVHFLRFEVTPPMRRALAGGAELVLGCVHPFYTEAVVVPETTLASLQGDLR